jgi:hypothetical protein
MPAQRLNATKRTAASLSGKVACGAFPCLQYDYLGADEVVCKSLVRQIGCYRGRSVVMSGGCGPERIRHAAARAE